MLGAWLRRLAALLTRRRLDAELEEEIRIHLEMATEEYVRRGMSPADARRAARKSFGGIEQVRERHREARGVPWLDGLLRDFRLAARTLLRDRGFTVTVVATLAVAVGAAASIFSVVDAVLLRPLPHPDADRIVSVGDEGSLNPRAFTDPHYMQFREESRAFEEVGAYRARELTLTDSGEPMRASVGLMTNSAFAVLRASPHRGRLPTGEEDLPGGPPVVLVSHGLWVARLNADPGAVGSSIELNDTTRQVIGVMPAEFGFPSERTDVWIPMRMDPASQDPRRRNNLIGRLREGATLEEGSADADRIVQRLQEAAPAAASGPARRVAVVTLKDRMVGDSRRLLLVVFGGMSIVLLIAFANVAGLFVVREEARSRQTTVRAVLGASRRRLAQHALSESVLLVLVGGLAGLALAYVGGRVLVALGPTGIPRLEGVGVSWTVVGCTAVASLLAGLVFGLLPSAGVRSGGGLAPSLSGGGRGATVGGDRLRLRGLLVMSQVALAVVLVIGSGLMVRSYRELASVDPGFDGSGVTSFGLVLPEGRYDNASAKQLYRELVDRLRARPEIEAAAVTTALPVSPLGGDPRVFGPVYQLRIEGVPDSVDVFSLRWVTPGYFETLRIPVVSGRTMLPEDRETLSFFISRSFAERYWPGSSAIDQRMELCCGRWAPTPVVGVVGDVHMRALDAPPEEAAYLPMGSPSPPILSVSVVVRTDGRDSNLAQLLRNEVRALDADVPLVDMQSMDELVAGSFAMSRTRFAMLLLAAGALVALLLGAVGVYGVIAYVVVRRRQEIGVRMALGARSSDILLRVVRRSLGPAVLGVAIGLGAGALASRVLSSLLFQTSPHDGATFVAGPAVLLVAAVAACVVPARRAIAIDPAETLRSE